jgi:hypothetical protein
MLNKITTMLTNDEIYIIDTICKRYSIRRYTINMDGSIDVRGDVDLSSRMLTKIPIKFNVVDGFFNCNDNYITSLEGCPIEVGGAFYCDYNQLKTLGYFPKKVGGNIWCDHNQLTSLKGCVKRVNGNFLCGDNKLLSLEYSPVEIDNSFDCSSNELTTLEYCPIEIGGLFYSNHNKDIDTFTKAFRFLGNDEQRVFLKYQSYYSVWTPEFNINGMNELIAEIKDGLR